MPYVEPVRLGNVVETLAQESHKPARLPELIVSSQFLRKLTDLSRQKEAFIFDARFVCERVPCLVCLRAPVSTKTNVPL